MVAQNRVVIDVRWPLTGGQTWLEVIYHQKPFKVIRKLLMTKSDT